MANFVNIFRKDSDITIEEIMDAYNKINIERFGGKLYFDWHEPWKVLAIQSVNDDGLLIFIRDKFKEMNEDGELKVISGKYIEMQHNHSNYFHKWLDCQFISELSRRLNAEIYEEGTGYMTVEDYSIYSFQTYLKKSCISLNTNKLNKIYYKSKMRDLKYLKSEFGKEFYDLFISEKNSN